MKIAFLTSIYPNHAKIIYDQYPKLVNKSSDEQLDFIRWNAALSTTVQRFSFLREKGFEVINFNEGLSEVSFKWAKENNFNPISNNPILEIGNEMIYRFRPDIIFCLNPLSIFKNNFFSELMKRFVKKPKTIAWYGANQGDEILFRNFDLTLSNSKHLVNRLKTAGIKSEILKHGFEPKILDKVNQTVTRKNKVCFFGNIETYSEDFLHRTRFLEKISNEIKSFDIFGETNKPDKCQSLKYDLLKCRNYISSKITKYTINKRIKYWSNKNNLPQNPWRVSRKFIYRIKDPMYGIKMLEEIGKYKLALNYHNNHTGDCACNMRLFEATGMGCLLISDNKSDIRDYFIPDTEIIIYNSTGEAIDKIKYLLNNPLVALKIASNGQKRCLKDHNSETRNERLCEILSSLITRL